MSWSAGSPRRSSTVPAPRLDRTRSDSVADDRAAAEEDDRSNPGEAMGNWYESRIDRAIREAQERGEFDDLPGTGKPLPDRGELYDEDWWIKQLVIRERLAGVAPTSLIIRKEVEDLPETLAKLSREAQVRAAVTALNTRIDQARRGQVDGPPVVLDLLDVEEVVAAWRRRREDG